MCDCVVYTPGGDAPSKEETLREREDGGVDATHLLQNHLEHDADHHHRCVYADTLLLLCCSASLHLSSCCCPRSDDPSPCLQGKPTSTNPVASIFAWTRGLAHRAKLDGNAPLAKWCADLEAAVIETIEAGKMTKDLALCVHGAKAGPDTYLNTEPFMDAIAATFKAKRAGKK